MELCELLKLARRAPLATTDLQSLGSDFSSDFLKFATARLSVTSQSEAKLRATLAAQTAKTAAKQKVLERLQDTLRSLQRELAIEPQSAGEVEDSVLRAEGDFAACEEEGRRLEFLLEQERKGALVHRARVLESEKLVRLLSDKHELALKSASLAQTLCSQAERELEAFSLAVDSRRRAQTEALQEQRRAKQVVVSNSQLTVQRITLREKKAKKAEQETATFVSSFIEQGNLYLKHKAQRTKLGETLSAFRSGLANMARLIAEPEDSPQLAAAIIRHMNAFSSHEKLLRERFEDQTKELHKKSRVLVHLRSLLYHLEPVESPAFPSANLAQLALDEQLDLHSPREEIEETEATLMKIYVQLAEISQKCAWDLKSAVAASSEVMAGVSALKSTIQALRGVRRLLPSLLPSGRTQLLPVFTGKSAVRGRPPLGKSERCSAANVLVEQSIRIKSISEAGQRSPQCTVSASNLAKEAIKRRCLAELSKDATVCKAATSIMCNNPVVGFFASERDVQTFFGTCSTDRESARNALEQLLCLSHEAMGRAVVALVRSLLRLFVVVKSCELDSNPSFHSKAMPRFASEHFLVERRMAVIVPEEKVEKKPLAETNLSSGDREREELEFASLMRESRKKQSMTSAAVACPPPQKGRQLSRAELFLQGLHRVSKSLMVLSAKERRSLLKSQRGSASTRWQALPVLQMSASTASQSFSEHQVAGSALLCVEVDDSVPQAAVALGLLRSVRLMSSGTEHGAAAHAAKDHHDAHDCAGHDHGHAEHHGDHHGHEPEDPNYFYNKYGPFHHYTFLNQCRPEDRHNTDQEDPYRNEVQGYIFVDDPSDGRRDPIRGAGEMLIAFTSLMIILLTFPRRHFHETDYADKKVGDALVTAQFIERFLEEHKKKE